MTFKQYAPESITVGTTVLRICGGADWTEAATYRGDVIFEICNVGASDVYVRPVASTTSLTGAVSASLHMYKLAAGDTIAVRQCDTDGGTLWDLAVVSASSAVVNVTPKAVITP